MVVESVMRHNAKQITILFGVSIEQAKRLDNLEKAVKMLLDQQCDCMRKA